MGRTTVNLVDQGQTAVRLAFQVTCGHPKSHGSIGCLSLHY